MQTTEVRITYSPQSWFEEEIRSLLIAKVIRHVRSGCS